jgi:hypothetical protein
MEPGEDVNVATSIVLISKKLPDVRIAARGVCQPKETAFAINYVG